MIESDIEEEIKIETELKRDIIQQEKQIVKYDSKQVFILLKRFKRLHEDAGRLLSQSQNSNRVSMTIKMIIIIFGLVTSYVSAISGIEDVSKTYITTIFGLGSAILSGLTSIKNFSKDSSKFYSGYTDYVEMCSIIEPIFHSFESEQSYGQLVNNIDKLISKYEGCIHKDKNVANIHSTRRPKVFENLVYDKIKNDNGGKWPHWLEKQIEVEVKHNTVDVRELIAKEDHIISESSMDESKIKIELKK
jgi:hypothetical protein